MKLVAFGEQMRQTNPTLAVHHCWKQYLPPVRKLDRAPWNPGLLNVLIMFTSRVFWAEVNCVLELTWEM